MKRLLILLLLLTVLLSGCINQQISTDETTTLPMSSDAVVSMIMSEYGLSEYDSEKFEYITKSSAELKEVKTAILFNYIFAECFDKNYETSMVGHQLMSFSRRTEPTDLAGMIDFETNKGYVVKEIENKTKIYCIVVSRSGIGETFIEPYDILKGK